MRYALGRNTLDVDGETAWLKLYEPWTVPLLQEAFGYVRAALDQYGRVLIVLEPFVDNPLPAEARRFLTDHQKDYSFNEIIIIKRSVLLRGVVALMHRARILFGGRAPNAPRFVDTPEEARILLAELRKKYQAQHESK